MPSVPQGASLLVTRTLQGSDGSALAPSAVSDLQVELMQRGEVKKTLALGAAEFRATAEDDALELEYTSTLTVELDRGLVEEWYTGTVPAATHTAEGGVRTIKFRVANVIIK